MLEASGEERHALLQHLHVTLPTSLLHLLPAPRLVCGKRGGGSMELNSLQSLSLFDTALLHPQTRARARTLSLLLAVSLACSHSYNVCIHVGLYVHRDRHKRQTQR